MDDGLCQMPPELLLDYHRLLNIIPHKQSQDLWEDHMPHGGPKGGLLISLFALLMVSLHLVDFTFTLLKPPDAGCHDSVFCHIPGGA